VAGWALSQGLAHGSYQFLMFRDWAIRLIVVLVIKSVLRSALGTRMGI